MLKMNSADIENAGVFELITELCNKTALKYAAYRSISHRRLVSKMRSRCYEIILMKTPTDIPESPITPLCDLLTYHYGLQSNIRNAADHRRAVKLKSVISTLQNIEGGVWNDNLLDTSLRFLISLKNTVKNDCTKEMFESPFSFGLLEGMLPRPPPEVFGSPEPYAYYPEYIFQLPYSLKPVSEEIVPTFNEYSVESFVSKSLPHCSTGPRYFPLRPTLSPTLSPMSIDSILTSQSTHYSLVQFPRLTTPRELVIPGSTDVHFKVTLPSSSGQSVKNELKEVFRGKYDVGSVDIWEIASQIDKDLPPNIWDVVSKMPALNERQLISSCSREVGLWRQRYNDVLADLFIITERHFIRNIMYLTIGVETSSFPYNKESECFYMREGLSLEGISHDCLQGYVSNLLLIGTYYKRLFNFAFNNSISEDLQCKGLVYEAVRETVRQYLLKFRLKATSMYDDCFNGNTEGNRLPTLLMIIHQLEPIKYEIEIIATIFKVTNLGDSSNSIPRGAELMCYLFDEISLVTHRLTSLSLFNSLFDICRVYFKFIERFIFEGELDDRYHEFFIRKDSQYINSCSKRYWDKGFFITESSVIPEFLKVLAKCILLCGKSLRLLKLCNPNDPLVVLISSDHPIIKCCATFEELEQQQQMLDVYRTRCLFVSGEPATFQQILLKKEAQRKAFTEMASIKQAETMEKIIAERKRLTQLIIAEKQHSLRVLEAAMAEAKAAKQRSKQREKLRTNIEHAIEKTREEVDSKIRDQEKSKIMEYYSKLNMAVEKSKMHAEWKIKRLQLDQSRVQLLSSEERNFKREKFELEHRRNEEVMAMSINSVGDEVDNTEPEKEDPESTDKPPKIIEVFNTNYNISKSVSLHNTKDNYDNEQHLDNQGNVIKSISEINYNITKDTEISKSNRDFLSTRLDALKNRDKAKSHGPFHNEFDNESLIPVISVENVDEENNIQNSNDPYAEAKMNRRKVLGTEFDIINVEQKPVVVEPRTDAQKQALINKQKILGVEYNLETKYVAKEPVNEAQEAAVRNKNKILGSEYDYKPLPKKPSVKRSDLTLNLKPYETVSKEGITPIVGSVTPAEYFQQLDLETPTTADVPIESHFTSDVLTAQNSDTNNKKQYLTDEGFNFTSLLVDDDGSGNMSDLQMNSNETSPHKSVNRDWTSQDELNKSDNFDPFGVHNIKSFGHSPINDEFHYTSPIDIMREVEKKPYANIFRSKGKKHEEEFKITHDNIPTLIACLQRSVMLPLTYQLEVVNNSILTYFLVNLDMYEHLSSLKDYFFLMDGEFSKNICHNLFDKLGKTINPSDLLNFSTLHNILDKALGSSISHLHKFSENLSFTISEAPLSFQHSSPDVLQCLSLTYAVSWPLNIILSPEALSRYAKVFQFLMKMRRISWILGQDFESMKLSVKLSGSDAKILLGSPHYRTIQIYRHVMASLIRALDNYIVTTCILTTWNEFEGALKKATTLDDLNECHVAYIKQILFRCLLNNRSTPVMKLLNDIFTVILKFSRVLKAGIWEQKEETDPFIHQNFNQLQELFHLFEKLAKYLHKVISRFMECGYQRHLVELLALVNLNGFYDPERSKDNSSLQSN